MFKLNLQFFAIQGYVKKATIGSVDTHSRLDINVDKEIKELYPNADPFIVMLLKARKKPVDTIRFEYYDNRPMAWWTKINNSGGYAAGATSIVIDDASIIAPKAIIKIPRTGEEMRVTAVTLGTNTLTVTRAYGSTAAAAIVDDDDILIMPNAMEDGYTTPEAVSTQPAMSYNYVQTFNTPVKLSRHAEEVAKRAGKSERGRLTREAMFQHRTGMERITLFSERYADAINQIYKTGGIVPQLSSNVFDLGGNILTEYDLDEICEQTFRKGNKTKVLVCGGKMQVAITRFAKERVRVSEAAKKYGLSLYEYQAAGGGVLMLAPSQTFENYYAGWGVIADMKNVDLRMFNDTVVRKDLQAKTDHGHIDEIETEFGVELRLEPTHGLIKNMKV
jgi:hypothetical protein